jgi:hypothetical protein
MASNWLRKLDVRARRLPRAANWLNYPLFMFARYPRLQPRVVIRSDRYVRSQVETGRETFNRVLATWEDRIRNHELARRVLEGLKATQSRQLVSLLFDTVVELEEHKAEADKRTRLRHLIEKGTSQGGKMQRLLVRASKSLEALDNAASWLAPEMGRQDFKSAAVHAKNALTPVTRHRTQEFWRNRRNTIAELLASKPHSKNPTKDLMVELYWFFRYGCRLTGDEAEVRVALLRNAFWTDFNVPTVNYLPEYQTGESKGCSAVHEAVRRWRPEQGTSR